MLNFYNSHIKFNCEIGVGDKYKLSASNIIPERDLELFLPQCTICKQYTTKEMKEHPGNYCFSINQFENFIQKWASYFELHQVIDKDWFSSYKECILLYGRALKEHTRDWLMNPNLCYQIIEKGEEDTESFEIVFDTNDFEPEISWAIEDCFWHLINDGKQSPFKKQVDKYIEINIERMQFQKKSNNLLYGNFKPVNIDIPLNQIRQFDDIDWNKEESFLYLYPPFCEERVRTNFIRIKQVHNFYRGL